jgi:hypothetical protein
MNHGRMRRHAPPHQSHSRTTAQDQTNPVQQPRLQASAAPVAPIPATSFRNTHMPSLAAVRRTLFTSASSSASSSRTNLIQTNRNDSASSNSRHASPRQSPERMFTPKGKKEPQQLSRMKTPSSTSINTAKSTDMADGSTLNGETATSSHLVPFLTPRTHNEDLIERDARGQPIPDGTVPISRSGRNHHPTQLGIMFPGEEDRLRATEDSGTLTLWLMHR